MLIVGRYFEPGFKAGGPVRSISNLISLLAGHLRISLLTSDRDYLDEKAYDDVLINTWHQLKSQKSEVNICYLSPNKRLRGLLEGIKSADTVYINSFFDPIFAIYTLIVGKLYSKQIVLAPRGEFAPSALNIKSSKKNLYLFFFRVFRLYNRINWHATNAVEKSQIMSLFDSTRVFIIPNLSREPAYELSKTEKKEGFLNIFFLGRVARMKNLDFAIEVLGRVKRRCKFSIYGPIDDTLYWELCQQQIAKLPEEVEVVYCGEAKQSQIASIVEKHDLLFMPSLGENFGHAIAETLARGIPTLVSDRTPWKDLGRYNAGWSFQLDDRKKFIKKIQELTDLDPHSFVEMRNATIRYYKHYHEESKALAFEGFMKIFTRA